MLRMMRQSIGMLVLLTVITGLIYPLVVTAIAQGYSSGQTTVSVMQLPVTLSLTLNTTTVVVGSSYQIGVTATSGAANVVGALSVATAGTGRFASGTALTNSLGQVAFLYSPQKPGSDQLTFNVSKQGFAPATVSSSRLP